MCDGIDTTQCATLFVLTCSLNETLIEIFFCYASSSYRQGIGGHNNTLTYIHTHVHSITYSKCGPSIHNKMDDTDTHTRTHTHVKVTNSQLLNWLRTQEYKTQGGYVAYFLVLRSGVGERLSRSTFP